MSDSDDYEYSDEEEYDYGSDENNGSSGEENDELIKIENKFYEAEDIKREKPEKSLQLFEEVVSLSREHSPEQTSWIYKALVHIVIINFTLGNSEQVVDRYTKLLSYIHQVTRNECNEAISNIVDHISQSIRSSTTSNAQPQVSISHIYRLTLDALKVEGNNNRLILNVYVKLGKYHLLNKDFGSLETVIDEVHAFIQSKSEDSGESNQSIGDNFLLDIYALEISLCEALNQKMKLKNLYKKITKIMKNAVIQDPRIMGSIHETGGKISMEEERWSDAYEEFFEAFRSYQEAGNAKARQCLKYVVLASMIALKDINPFDSREAKVYKEDIEINAMVELRQAFEASDIRQFERILRDKSYGVSQDAFIMTYVTRLMRNIRGQILLRLVKPYSRVSLDFLTKEVNVDTVEQVESLLVSFVSFLAF